MVLSVCHYNYIIEFDEESDSKPDKQKTLLDKIENLINLILDQGSHGQGKVSEK